MIQTIKMTKIARQKHRAISFTLHPSVQLCDTVTFNTVRCPCNGLAREAETPH